MNNQHLHIIAWDIPFPANYGGVIDVFYKLKYLHAVGVKIILHCFQYGDRMPTNELLEYCESVHYYPRKIGWKGIDSNLPYIVSSRRSEALLECLCQDEYPILFDGLHTTALLNHSKLKHRKKYLRAQNVEQDYYLQLAPHAKSIFKKIYCYLEANRLKTYEDQLQNLDGIITVAQHDYTFFKNKYPNIKHLYLPSFHQNDIIKSPKGKGAYCLYQGNLSVPENEQAVLFLLKEIIPRTTCSWVIAGKNPSDYIKQCQNNRITIVANPDDAKMEMCIQDAHINVLPSFQTTGLKLKLLHALFEGRFVLTNPEMVVGTQLDQAVLLATTPQEFIETIEQYMNINYDLPFVEKREQLLQHYLPPVGAKKLVDFIV